MRTSIDSVTATPTVSPVSSLMRRKGPFEEDIARVLEDIELAKRLNGEGVPCPSDGDLGGDLLRDLPAQSAGKFFHQSLSFPPVHRGRSSGNVLLAGPPA